MSTPAKFRTTRPDPVMERREFVYHDTLEEAMADPDAWSIFRNDRWIGTIRNDDGRRVLVRRGTVVA